MAEGPQPFPRPAKSNKATSGKATEIQLATTPAIDNGRGSVDTLRGLEAQQGINSELAEMRGMLATMLQMAARPQSALDSRPDSLSDALPDTAQASLVKRVLNSNRTNSARFLLVVVPDDDNPQLEEFPSVDELVTRLRELIGTPCHAFPILGTRLAITGDTHKQLSTPYGSIPLFDIPVLAPVDASHAAWLGGKPAVVITSPQEETEDEYEDEEEA